MRRFWQEWRGAWETLRFDYELIDAGDRVVQLVRRGPRGPAGARAADARTRHGIEVSADNYANVATFGDGRMVHWKLYMSHEEALEDGKRLWLESVYSPAVTSDGDRTRIRSGS